MSDEQAKYELTHTPQPIKIRVSGDINFPTRTVEELWIEIKGRMLVIDKKWYFKFDEEQFEDFCRKAEYVEVDNDEFPERITTKVIQSVESLNAFAYENRGGWISIQNSIEYHEKSINKLKALL